MKATVLVFILNSSLHNGRVEQDQQYFASTVVLDTFVFHSK